MIISKQKNVIDIRIRDSILKKVLTVKFVGGMLDENLTLMTIKQISLLKYMSVGVMRRLHWQLPADVMVNLYYSLVYSPLTYELLAWERSGRTNASKIECAHRRACKLIKDYNQRILTFLLVYDYFAVLKGFQHKYKYFSSLFQR